MNNPHKRNKIQVNSALQMLVPVAEAIATLLKPYAEVVLHDLATMQITHIANNFSRRKVGDSSLTDLKDIGSLEEQVIGPYRKINFDNRELKSITSVIRDENGHPTGLLCINMDIAHINAARQALTLLSGFGETINQPAALFQSDWQEQVNNFIAGFLNEKGMAATALAKADHAELIALLEREGYFSIRNLVPYLTRLLGISRATIYNHLRAARSGSAT